MSLNIGLKRFLNKVQGVLPTYNFFQNYIGEALVFISARLAQIDVDSLNQQL